MTSPDFVEILQARMCAGLEEKELAHKSRRPRTRKDDELEILRAQVAALEEAVVNAENLERTVTTRSRDSGQEDCGSGSPHYYVRTAFSEADLLSERRLQIAVKQADRLFARTHKMVFMRFALMAEAGAALKP